MKHVVSVRSVLLWLCVLFGATLFGGCKSKWKYLRTINPYSKVQLKDPYSLTIRLTGGGEIKLEKFYVTKTLACAMLLVDNTRGESKLYLNPNKAQFVTGKTGIWAQKSTVTARDLTYRAMIAHFYKLNPKSVSSWSQYHFPLGSIEAGKTKKGAVCFRLAESEEDPKALKLEKRSRMRFTGLLLGGGSIGADWLWLGRM